MRGLQPIAVYATVRLVEISWRRVWRNTAGLLLFWSALIALFAIHRYSVLTEAGEWLGWSESFGGLAAYMLGWIPLSALLLFTAERLPLADERRLRNFGLAILAVVVVAYLRIALTTILVGDPHSAAAPRSVGAWDFALFRRNAAAMRYQELTNAAFYMACFTAFSAHRLAVERARRSDQLEARLARAELDNLRSQLQPHFLFNALNAVTTLIRKDPDAAEQTLGHVSDLLRRSLEAAERQLITLAREIDFVERYIAIQHVRFGDRLRISIDIDAAARPVMVPSMILQPIVENAIRHSIARREGGTIAVSARAEEATVVIRVTDDGEGIAGEGEEGLGIGLSNARARLEHLFGSAASIAIEDVPGSFTVEIRVPRRTA